ncbi:MAG: hypothetical protein JXA21_18790 [Anaerolineae bacterium]|nr:hypothetical protein [Anaerolineae bacterium]
MTIPGPVVLVMIPVLLFSVLQLLRRWTALMAWFAAAASAFLGLFVALAPLDRAVAFQGVGIVLGQPLVILGRAMAVEPVDRLPLAFIYLTAAGIFVIAWRLLPHSNFFPTGLMMVTLLAGALMVEQVVYTALLVEMAAVLAIFSLHEPSHGPRTVTPPDDSPAVTAPPAGGGEPEDVAVSAPVVYGGRAKGGLRYLAYTTLALPGLVITQLLLELFAIFPNDSGLLKSATILLALSFAILLGAIPFQSWLSTVAMDGSPPVVTFLFTVNLGAVWFMLLAYLESYNWLSAEPFFGPLATVLGLLMMVLGGALAASQRRLGRLVGYATLVDNGAMFVALGTREVTGLALTVMMLMARPLALGLMTIGLDGLRRLGDGDDSAQSMEGGAWQAPWRAVAFIVGGVAMAGFPLSLGFAARWGLFRLMVVEDLFQAVMALTGSAGVMLGVIGAVRTLLTRAPQNRYARFVEDRVVLVLILVLIVATLGFGLVPQTVSHLALQMAQEFTFFAP